MITEKQMSEILNDTPLCIGEYDNMDSSFSKAIQFAKDALRKYSKCSEEQYNKEVKIQMTNILNFVNPYIPKHIGQEILEMIKNYNYENKH